MVEIVAAPETPAEVIKDFQRLGLPPGVGISSSEWDTPDGRHAIWNGMWAGGIDINWNGQKALLPVRHIAYFDPLPKRKDLP